jgi:hypothetical protein
MTHKVYIEGIYQTVHNELWNTFRGYYRIETYKEDPGYTIAVI